MQKEKGSHPLVGNNSKIPENVLTYLKIVKISENVSAYYSAKILLEKVYDFARIIGEKFPDGKSIGRPPPTRYHDNTEYRDIFRHNNRGVKFTYCCIPTVDPWFSNLIHA